MELQRMVMDHVRQEESELFAAIRNNCSTEQQEQIATEFKEAKKQFQTQMLNR
jgi:hemerythrin-like domain-containing protein